MKTLLFTLCTISSSWAADLSEVYEKAYFLENAKGKTTEATELYRKIAAAKATNENRKVIVKSLKRLLHIYQMDQPSVAKLEDYLAKLNLDFQQGTMGPMNDMPKYWMGGGKGYALSTEDRAAEPGNACGKITRTDNKGVFGTFTSALDPGLFRGKTVELSGWMKLESVEGAVGLWLRSDVEKKVATFYNMHDQKIKGTRDWKRYAFEIEIPQDVTNINFGALLSGDGTMWVDDLEVKILEKK